MLPKKPGRRHSRRLIAGHNERPPEVANLNDAVGFGEVARPAQDLTNWPTQPRELFGQIRTAATKTRRESGRWTTGPRKAPSPIVLVHCPSFVALQHEQ